MAGCSDAPVGVEHDITLSALEAVNDPLLTEEEKTARVQVLANRVNTSHATPNRWTEQPQSATSPALVEKDRAKTEQELLENLEKDILESFFDLELERHVLLA